MATAIAMTFEEAMAHIHPEYASAATVHVPGYLQRGAYEIDSWARHAARANGFGAPEAVEGNFEEQQESLFETACRIAASLVR